jgi:hypothetical protein
MAVSSVIHQSADWPAFAGVDWARTILTVPVTDRFHAKQGRSIGRWTLTDSEGRELVVYLKRHFELPRRHGLLARLFPGSAWSPGLQEWEHLNRAAAAGLPVPRAVATGEFRGPGLKLQSFLAVEELTGMLALHEAVPLAHTRLAPSAFASWKRGLIRELARLARELHRHRLFHKDLYLCHFYIAEADTSTPPDAWRGRVVMIDFHRLGRHRLGWQWYVSKDLAQFLYSSEVPGIDAKDRLRFWKLYRGGDWGESARPPAWLRRAVSWKWKRYREHNAKRKGRTGATG